MTGSPADVIDALRPDDAIAALRPYTAGFGASSGLFTMDDLARDSGAVSSPECAQVIATGLANTASWDSDVFGPAMKPDGVDLSYDATWSQVQVASAWLVYPKPL